MNQNGLLSVTDSTPFVMLNVEQFRHVIRQEILSVVNQKTNTSMGNKNMTQDDSIGDRPYLTIAEAAKLGTLAPSTIRLYIRRGKLKAEGVGRRRIISRAELDRFMAVGGT
jgi:excisionase family DNA binding protein